MILNISLHTHSKNYVAYKRAMDEFAELFYEQFADQGLAPLGNRKLFYEKFEHYIDGKFVIPIWYDDIPKVTGIEFADEKALTWFLLRYS